MIPIVTPTGQGVKMLKYSHDGKHFAFCTATCTFLYESSSSSASEQGIRLISTLNSVTNVLDLEFSPLDGHLSVLETFNAAANEKNLKVYKIDHSASAASVTLAFSFCQKIGAGSNGCWAPQFSSDESTMVLLRNKNISIWSIDGEGKLVEHAERSSNLSGVLSFCLVNHGGQMDLCCFYKGSSGANSSFKVMRFPNFDTPLCSRSLPNADNVEFVPVEGSANAQALPRLLLVTSSDHDKTGKSYYGQSSLYFFSCSGQGEDARVSFDKAGPVHHCAWNGAGEEFVALYGFMPSKGAIYDGKCNVVKDFGEISRNTCSYTSNGSLFYIGGFGNLSGCIDIWHRKSMKKVCTFQEPGASICEWMADGMHLLAAIVSPRLRVDNGFKIFNLMGQKVFSKEYSELFNVVLQPLPAGNAAELTFEECKARSSPLLTAQTVKKVGAYVPPSMRKNGSSGSIASAKSAPVVEAPSTLNPREKAIKNLKKKLEDIANLKEKMASGQKMEINQLEKISKEAEYKKELAALDK